MTLFLPLNYTNGTSDCIYTPVPSTLNFRFPKYLIVLFFLVGFSNYANGQIAGDYKANATTLNWDALASWLRYDGAGWSTPTAVQGYPGFSNTPGTVTIQTGQTVTLNVSPANSIRNLDVQGTGKLTIGTTSNTYRLKISGNITFGTGPSSLYDPINMKAGSGIGEFEFTGTSLQTISGDSGGNCYFYNFYVTGTGGLKLIHDMVIMGDLMVYTNCTFDISTYLCNKTSAPNMTFTLQPGSIFRLSGTAGGTDGSSGSNFPVRISGGTFAYSFNATSTVDYYGVAQTISPAATSYGNLTLSGSGAKTTTGVTVNGILSLEGTATTTGTAPAYSTAATLQYKGSAAQTTGNELPATFSGAGGIIINNNFGVTLNKNATVSGTTLISSVNSGLIIPKNICLKTNAITTTNYNQIYIKAGTNGTDANGSLIFQNTGPVYGTVEMYSKAAASIANPPSSYKWQFFGIPLHALSSASPTFDGGYVRQMHENDSPSHWEQLSNSSGLTPFTGYEITQLAARTYIFQGQLENSNFPATKMQYTSVASYPGQNLIGNPYTAAIEISNIGLGAKMYKTVYIYNTGSKSDWTTNGSGIEPNDSTHASLAGQYTAIPYALAGKAGLQHQIPSMQAFLVKAMSNDATATLSIPYSSVVADSVPQRTKGLISKTSSGNIYTIIDVKGSRFSDRMWLFTDPDCSHGFDNGWDGEKVLGSYLTPQIYAMETDGDYQVNSVEDVNNTYIGFQAGEDSLYTLTFSHQNLGLKYGNVYLVDSVKHKTIDITTSGTKYTFLSLPTDNIIKRFKIVTNQDISTNNTSPRTERNQLNVFSSQHTIFIDNQSDNEGSLSLYDISGRFIQKFKFSPSGITTLRTDLSSGSYLVKAITKNQTVSKQLLLQ